jgi:hypothetical protein
MKFNATISLSPQEVTDIILKHLRSNGVEGLKFENVHYRIEEFECGNQMNPFKKHLLARVEIDNVKIGNDQ